MLHGQAIMANKLGRKDMHLASVWLTSAVDFEPLMRQHGFRIKSEVAMPWQVGILLCMGRGHEAEIASRRALAIQETAFGPQSKETAAALHGLAETLSDLSRWLLRPKDVIGYAVA